MNMPSKLPTHEYTGYIEPTKAGNTIRWRSWSDRPSAERWMPITLFPHATGSDYTGCSVERSNHDVLLENEHVMRRSVRIVGGHGTFGVAYIGRPTRPIKKIINDLEVYPLIDEDHHSNLEMALEIEAWDDHGRGDFRSALANVLDGVDPTYEHDVDLVSDDVIDTLWRGGVDAYNVNGGSGYMVETGCTVHFYIDEWTKRAAERRPFPGWSGHQLEWWHHAQRKMEPMLCAVARAARVRGATTMHRRREIRAARRARVQRKGWWLMTRRSRLMHSDLAAVVYYDERTLAYRDKRFRGWRMLPTGDEIVDRATNHAISGNPDNISAGDLRRAIADNLE